MKDLFKFYQQPDLQNPSLIVGWKQDAGQLSPQVIDYLNKKIKAKSFCEIEPIGFFSLAGVAIENDIAQFPDNIFYCSQRNDLVIFKGSEPQAERYKFLNTIFDLAQHYCKVKEIYTVNGTISSIAHSDSRKILAVFNQQQFQKNLQDRGFTNMTWKGPPAISSYLLWIAKNRGIPAISLWTQIPFYLAASVDYQAIKIILDFLDRNFHLNLDLGELDEKINKQDLKITQIREQAPEIDRYINMLESKLSLSGEEQVELTRKITEALEQNY